MLFCDLWVPGLASFGICAVWLLVGLDLLILCLWLVGVGLIYVCGCGGGVCLEVGLDWIGLAEIMGCMCWVGNVVCGSWLFGVSHSLKCAGVP